MIELTRLNNRTISLNSDLIKYVEQAPDTVITLVTGEKLVVKEAAEEVIRRVIQFRRMLLADLHRGPILRNATPESDKQDLEK